MNIIGVKVQVHFPAPLLPSIRSYFGPGSLFLKGFAEAVTLEQVKRRREMTVAQNPADFFLFSTDGLIVTKGNGYNNPGFMGN